MPQRSGKRRKRSTYYDVDVLEWLEARGVELDRTVDYQIREILRTAMNADQTAPVELRTRLERLGYAAADGTAACEAGS
jgi:hypothetical protein